MGKAFEITEYDDISRLYRNYKRWEIEKITIDVHSLLNEEHKENKKSEEGYFDIIDYVVRSLKQYCIGKNIKIELLNSIKSHQNYSENKYNEAFAIIKEILNSSPNNLTIQGEAQLVIFGEHEKMSLAATAELLY